MEYGNKTTLVSLNDSLLQNLHPSKQKRTDIVVYNVAEKLSQKNVGNILPIDCGNLFINKQHNITEFLKNNLSLSEIKTIQKLGIDAARHGIAKLGISEKIKNYYNVDERDYDIHISDAIKESKQVGVLLSCVSNDMMNSVYANPIGNMIAKLPFMDKTALERTKILLEDIKLRQSIIDGIKTNIEQILGINDKACICLFGIYRPNIMPKDFDFIFQEINSKLQQVSKEYNQDYIDINSLKSKIIDFHPTSKGYEIIAEKVASKLLEVLGKKQSDMNINDFKYNNLGLDGAIKDIESYEQQEIEYVNGFVNYIVQKYNYSEACAKEILNDLVNGRPSEVREMGKIYSKAKEILM